MNSLKCCLRSLSGLFIFFFVVAYAFSAAAGNRDTPGAAGDPVQSLEASTLKTYFGQARNKLKGLSQTAAARSGGAAEEAIEELTERLDALKKAVSGELERNVADLEQHTRELLAILARDIYEAQTGLAKGPGDSYARTGAEVREALGGLWLVGGEDYFIDEYNGLYVPYRSRGCHHFRIEGANFVNASPKITSAARLVLHHPHGARVFEGRATGNGFTFQLNHGLFMAGRMDREYSTMEADLKIDISEEGSETEQLNTSLRFTLSPRLIGDLSYRIVMPVKALIRRPALDVPVARTTSSGHPYGTQRTTFVTYSIPAGKTHEPPRVGDWRVAGFDYQKCESLRDGACDHVRVYPGEVFPDGLGAEARVENSSYPARVHYRASLARVEAIDEWVLKQEQTSIYHDREPARIFIPEDFLRVEISFRSLEGEVSHELFSQAMDARAPRFFDPGFAGTKLVKSNVPKGYLLTFSATPTRYTFCRRYREDDEPADAPAKRANTKPGQP